MDGEPPTLAKALVQEHDVPNPKQAVVRFANLERVFRTSSEQRLGRDFTTEEQTAYERKWDLRVAMMAEERAREDIVESIEQIAMALDRAASDLRHELTSEYVDPSQKAERAQRDVARLFPNLNFDRLTRLALEWATSRQELNRLLTEGAGRDAYQLPSDRCNP
jgi:hypothetical protein